LFAGQAANAIGNAFLLEETRRHAEQLAAGEAELRSYAERLRALSMRLVEVQEAERKRIAAELHDRVGQTLTALSISLNVLKARLPADAAIAVQPQIEDGLGLVESTAEGIREVIADLRPAVLDDYGLPAALRWHAEQFEQRTGIATRVVADASIRLPPASEAAIYRIAQEALTNVAKHAKASVAEVRLMASAKTVSLTVTDDGKGFDPSAGPMVDHLGWGLMIMRERAEALGGWFALESAPGEGARVEVAIPR
jgi:signal transduction histidine kinase